MKVPYRKRKKPLRGVGVHVGAMSPICPNAIWACLLYTSPTLSGALSQVLGASFSSGSSPGSSSTTPTGGTTTSGGSAASYLKQASADYTSAQAALQAGNLGQYQADVNAMNAQLKLAQAALAK